MGRAGPEFEDDREAQDALDLIMGQYKEVLQSLAEPRRYKAILSDGRAGVVISELRAGGFHTANVRLPLENFLPEMAGRRCKDGT